MPPRFAALEARMVPRSLPVGGRRVMTSMTDSALDKDIKITRRVLRDP